VSEGARIEFGQERDMFSFWIDGHPSIYRYLRDPAYSRRCEES
jgi:hypothetical protein